ncbi:MAG: helix-turn-helix transcriptional regulator [Schwartzia sp.]|nr:helix-turn-helix transcriptional regulator [Schwartzia sp. (in: firmicutes)]
MFSDKLRYLREHQEYTQVDVAQKLGIGQTTYNRYERGLYEPNYETLKKIANFFQVSIDYLLDNDEVLLSDADTVVDLGQFLLHGKYTICSRFPKESDRRMLDSIVKAIYTAQTVPTDGRAV